MEDSPIKLDRIWRNPDGTFKSGHPRSSDGRPKGRTLKEFARDYLMGLPDNEKTEYIASLPQEIVWKMAEGLPQQDLTSGGEKINPTPIINVLTNNGDNKDNQTKQENQNSPGRNVSQQDGINNNILDSTKPIG